MKSDKQSPARVLPTVDQRKSLAAKAFPNHMGNYGSKRDEKPEPKLRTAQQRFFGLRQMFELMARSYRWKSLAIMLIAVLLALNTIGCANQAGSAVDLTTAIVAQASIVRAVVAAQPPGAKRDKLLAEIDSAILAGNIVLLEEKLLEAKAVAPTTQPK